LEEREKRGEKEGGTSLPLWPQRYRPCIMPPNIFSRGGGGGGGRKEGGKGRMVRQLLDFLYRRRVNEKKKKKKREEGKREERGEEQGSFQCRRSAPADRERCRIAAGVSSKRKRKKRKETGRKKGAWILALGDPVAACRRSCRAFFARPWRRKKKKKREEEKAPKKMNDLTGDSRNCITQARSIHTLGGGGGGVVS